jgi:hypothetical protein
MMLKREVASEHDTDDRYGQAVRGMQEARRNRERDMPLVRDKGNEREGDALDCRQSRATEIHGTTQDQRRK